MTVWAGWLRYAVGDLRLTPREFWDLSLREWLMLTQGPVERRMERRDLEQLMLQFPDDHR